MGLPQRDLDYHTYADYCSWPDEVRYELIDGVAYAMGPAPVRRHQGILLELARQVANILEGSPCRPYIAPFDVRLPKKDEIDDDVDVVGVVHVFDAEGVAGAVRLGEEPVKDERHLLAKGERYLVRIGTKNRRFAWLTVA